MFFDLLVDGDVASNVGNWQWVAGTGANARRNRVLAPLGEAALRPGRRLRAKVGSRAPRAPGADRARAVESSGFAPRTRVPRSDRRACVASAVESQSPCRPGLRAFGRASRGRTTARSRPSSACSSPAPRRLLDRGRRKSARSSVLARGRTGGARSHTSAREPRGSGDRPPPSSRTFAVPSSTDDELSLPAGAARADGTLSWSSRRAFAVKGCGGVSSRAAREQCALERRLARPPGADLGARRRSEPPSP